jgi:hypothetical protein
MSRSRRVMQHWIPADPVHRRYLLLRLVSAIGDGLFLTGSIVFFTKVVGLSPAQVGAGLSAAGIAGFIASGTLGFLSDRFGPKRVLVTFNILQCVAYLSYALARNFLAFAAIACIIGVLDFGKAPAASAMMRSIAGEADRVSLRARARTAANAGICAGSLLAAAGLAAHTEWIYYALILGNSASFAISALLASTIDDGHSRARSRGLSLPSMTALRNGRLMLVVGLNAIMALHASLITVTIPLWIISRTRAGTWTIGVLLLINTVLVILFQLVVSKNTEHVSQLVRSARRAAILILIACLLFGLSARTGPAGAVVLLLAGGVFMAFAEMLQAASTMGISFALAPVDVQGQYLGVSAMSMALQGIIGPGVCSFLVIRYGLAGWLGLALAIGMASILLGPATRAAVISVTDRHQLPESQTA